tara:strand:- start:123339 stop:124412 length:1074 start_codon:yes stop_codon:yes gene_type:complete
MKILTIVGARPQFIKAAAVSRAINEYDDIHEVIVHTGQHFDESMSDVFFREMSIPDVKYNLKINGLTHGAMTGQMLEKIEEVILNEKPDWVLVYGDTNSTLAGALAASKLHVKVAHVEAGLRSFNMRMPEEQNRVLTDRISSVLFCPTENAVENLKSEGFESLSVKIKNVGDVMFDATRFYEKSIGDKARVEIDGKYLLVTCHRAENTDNLDRFKEIILALNELSKKYKIVFPLHPRTKKVIENNKIKLDFKPIEPVGYFDMLKLIKNSEFVMTDSGGLQKEAYFHQKYCLTMRDETEWVELIENKVNVLTGACSKKILQEARRISNLKFNSSTDLYGDGNSADLIIKSLINLQNYE